MRVFADFKPQNSPQAPFVGCCNTLPTGHKRKGDEFMSKTLRDSRPGETVCVISFLGTGAVRRRLMDMGITKGTKIFVRKMAPLGDPIEVTVRGYELSLRKDEAAHIEVA